MSAITAASKAMPPWVAELKNPPAYKSKQAGIPDPPGYPSSQTLSSSKVALSPALYAERKLVGHC